ncbi:MAG TPA: NAD(P)/FAD-dependent oxidoreductase [Kiloniellaceae bacterium]|nr:NAD(P)/FAD-dependent oxidoreductase [Kiloniellaceae bacterium]
MEHVDCVVVGAGVIGLAAARALLAKGRDVLILERSGRVGSETSSRNSEVIHAGIYYPTDSLKARMCVAGKAALYAFCGDHRVTARAVGKLIVAVEESERPRLKALRELAEKNGVQDLVEVDREALRRLEPDLNCVAALFSPSTGILDSHGYLTALHGEVESRGGFIAFNTPVESGAFHNGVLQLRTGGAAAMDLSCSAVVNAAGHGAIALASRIAGFPKSALPDSYLAKGRYLSLLGHCPFSHLIYPLPAPGGLGIHLTLDIAGAARFGPDVEWVEELDYSVPAGLEARFAAAIARYWPDISASNLTPAYAGIRPKLHGPDVPFADFAIQDEAVHGLPGLINLFGIESPGLTSSLAIARYIAERLCSDHA